MLATIILQNKCCSLATKNLCVRTVRTVHSFHKRRVRQYSRTAVPRVDKTKAAAGLPLYSRLVASHRQYNGSGQSSPVSYRGIKLSCSGRHDRRGKSHTRSLRIILSRCCPPQLFLAPATSSRVSNTESCGGNCAICCREGRGCNRFYTTTDGTAVSR